MNRTGSTSKIRIKDIAEKAKTSIGTVDRVLHGRPNVSAEVRKRVEEAIKEMGYEPNRYASALASNKSYHFKAFFPIPDKNQYWFEAATGLRDAVQEYRDFNIILEEIFFDPNDLTTYFKGLESLINSNTDGIILAPQEPETTRSFCQELEKRQIPYAFLDSDIPDLPALTFYGQDSIMSGHFAARITLLEAIQESAILIVHFDIPSLAQSWRESGFKAYLNEKAPQMKIYELTVKAGGEDLQEQMMKFRAQHPEVHFLCTFCSFTYRIADFINKNKITDWHLMGYDMMDENVKYLKEDIIRFLIAQHPWQQGYGCVDALFQHIVLKKEIKRTNFMPIELLTAENCDYYLKNAKTTY